jgi:hypothetical protein
MNSNDAGAGTNDSGAGNALRPKRPSGYEMRRAAAAQRVGVAIAELSVGARELQAKKIGDSSFEYYELQRIIAELRSLATRLP